MKKDLTRDFFYEIIHIVELIQRRYDKCENMTISDRIFERLQQLSISQKEFAGKAGIQQSTISEWKKNKTNPSSDDVGDRHC